MRSDGVDFPSASRDTSGRIVGVHVSEADLPRFVEHAEAFFGAETSRIERIEIGHGYTRFCITDPPPLAEETRSAFAALAALPQLAGLSA